MHNDLNIKNKTFKLYFINSRSNSFKTAAEFRTWQKSR